MSELRKGYFGKDGKPGPWDAIVIGSGIGSMTAAALLAKLGRKVLVLEQHYVPGGFTHTFTRKQYRFDVGVHAVGEVTVRSMPGRLLKVLTDGKLEWVSLGPVYDAFHWPDGVDLDYPDNPEAYRENLLRAFPREQKAIDEYLGLARHIASGMRGYYLSRVLPHALSGPAERLLARKVKPHLEATTRPVLASLTSDPRLRSVFAGQWGYYGSTPSRSAFAMQALVVKHFLWGGYYPRGGSQQIAATLLGTVHDAGGWTRIMADVEQVLVESGRAVGVRLKGGEELRAPLIISGAGAHRTLQLLPEALQQQGWSQSLKSLRPAPAHVCLYLGFKGNIRAAGATAANQWYWETWDSEDDAWRVSAGGEQPRAPVLYTSFPFAQRPGPRGRRPPHRRGGHLRAVGDLRSLARQALAPARRRLRVVQAAAARAAARAALPTAAGPEADARLGRGLDAGHHRALRAPLARQHLRPRADSRALREPVLEAALAGAGVVLRRQRRGVGRRHRRDDGWRPRRRRSRAVGRDAVPPQRRDVKAAAPERSRRVPSPDEVSAPLTRGFKQHQRTPRYEGVSALEASGERRHPRLRSGGGHVCSTLPAPCAAHSSLSVCSPPARAQTPASPSPFTSPPTRAPAPTSRGSSCRSPRRAGRSNRLSRPSRACSPSRSRPPRALPRPRGASPWPSPRAPPTARRSTRAAVSSTSPRACRAPRST
ncbi:MAG: NAD(P)-binding protein [Archangiaceae bacterium]|nr:NAD(P)-binding protein [Archangiaceae bacterium]